MITRRGMLLGSGAVLLVAPAARASVEGDAGVVERALRLEQLAAAGMGAGATADLVDEADARALLVIAEHDREHVAVLGGSLEALGARRPPEPEDLPAADALARELDVDMLTGSLTRPDDFLAWAIALKEQTIAGYVDACRRLLDVRLTQSLASMLGAEAQHLVALRETAGRPAVGAAFPGRG